MVGSPIPRTNCRGPKWVRRRFLIERKVWTRSPMMRKHECREKGWRFERNELLLGAKRIPWSRIGYNDNRPGCTSQSSPCIEAHCDYHGRCRTWVKATGRPTIWRDWMNDVNASPAFLLKYMSSLSWGDSCRELETFLMSRSSMRSTLTLLNGLRTSRYRVRSTSLRSSDDTS